MRMPNVERERERRWRKKGEKLEREKVRDE